MCQTQFDTAASVDTSVTTTTPRSLPRRRARNFPIAQVPLGPQQSVQIVDPSGRPLFHLSWNEQGPVIALASEDCTLDVSGKLRVAAESIEMVARDEDLRLLAAADVVVRGEKIRLN